MTQSTAKASTSIPFILRFPLLWLEPIFAVNGAVLVLLDPSKYTSTMTRGTLFAVQPSSEFIFTQLAAGWLYFAFTEGVILRLVDEVRIWKLLCMSMLVSDIVYCHSCAEALGGWAEFVVIGRWTAGDWAVALGTWPFFFARLAIVLGIGEKKGSSSVEKAD